MTQQPEALRLANELESYIGRPVCTDAAAELRRLHEENKALLSVLSDVAYGLESARIWGGMDWSYNPIHPFKYLPLRDKARAAIAEATGEST
ncbi:hypothetical protein UFOVP417_18 [uncultured Caudovirales phage]|uniref:Uncharacterized protein n=1 Tax=uncultured Caudovirales phage TaxID=2100421 RepID=A0A6J5M8H2_9CAUD|nr:hypothetical protein UFOVP417_18 [uncultured Caudovirales phage]